jgi:hypothetical protein
MFFIARDGEALSFEAVKANWRQVVQSHITNANDGWRLVGYDVNYVNWENAELHCGHTGERIESAYA